MSNLRAMPSDRLLAHVLTWAGYLVDGETTKIVALEVAEGSTELQRRYNAVRRASVAHPAPDSGDPAVDLMRRVFHEGDGYLAVTAGEIRRTYGTEPDQLAESLAGRSLLTLPARLPGNDKASVVLYSGLATIGVLLSQIGRHEPVREVMAALEQQLLRGQPGGPPPTDIGT